MKLRQCITKVAKLHRPIGIALFHYSTTYLLHRVIKKFLYTIAQATQILISWNDFKYIVEAVKKRF